MMVYPDKQWQTVTYKFTLIPQAPEASPTPLLAQADFVAALLITISDLLSVLEAFRIRPLSLLGTPSRFPSVSPEGAHQGLARRLAPVMKHRGGGPHFRTSRDIFTGHAYFISREGNRFTHFRLSEPPFPSILSGVDPGIFSCLTDGVGTNGPVRISDHCLLGRLRIGVLGLSAPAQGTVVRRVSNGPRV